MSAEPGNDRNDCNSDPSGDEAILNGGRRRLVFQKDTNFLDHARNVGRSSEWSVNAYRKLQLIPATEWLGQHSSNVWSQRQSF